MNHIPFPELINPQLFFYHGKKTTIADLPILVDMLHYREMNCQESQKRKCTDFTFSKIALSVYRRAMGWTSSVPFPAEASDCSLLHNVQNGSESHTAFSPMGTSSLGVKRQGRESDQSYPFSAEVKNGGALLPFFHTSL